MVKVSICIPAYNNATALRRLLLSISKQDYKDYEIILTDDSESDLLKEVIREFSSLGIQYYKNEHNLGPAPNINKALSLATGEYIKVMHHDDRFVYPDSLRKMVNLLEDHPDVDFAFCSTWECFYHSDGTEVVDQRREHHISEVERWQLDTDYRNLFLVNMIGIPSATIYRNRKQKFDDSLQWLVDIDLYLRILENNNKYVDTDECLIEAGLSDTQVTQFCIANPKVIFNETRYVYKKYQFSYSKDYRKYLIRMAISLKIPYRELRVVNIPFHSYLNHKARLTVKKMIKK